MALTTCRGAAARAAGGRRGGRARAGAAMEALEPAVISEKITRECVKVRPGSGPPPPRAGPEEACLGGRPSRPLAPGPATTSPPGGAGRPAPAGGHQQQQGRQQEGTGRSPYRPPAGAPPPRPAGRHGAAPALVPALEPPQPWSQVPLVSPGRPLPAGRKARGRRHGEAGGRDRVGSAPFSPREPEREVPPPGTLLILGVVCPDVRRRQSVLTS